MKRKITLIAGCSHSAGSEIDGNEDSDYNRKNSFGGVLSNMLDREPVNIAINGATNATIARSVLNWVESQYDEDTMDVFVVVAWTEPARMELSWPTEKYYNESNKYADWYDKDSNMFNRILFGWNGMGKDENEIFPYFHRLMAEHPSLLETWSVNLVLQLQYFFKSTNISYVMCNTMHMFTPDDKALEPLLKHVDTNNYYKLRSTQDEAFYWKYRHMGYINERAKYWHHCEEPHKLFAEELLTFIKENKCLG